jgi:hypothetical protein
MGQQESPVAHMVCLPASTHLASQVLADPSSFCSVQPIAGQAVGQVSPGSQVSPASTALFPQLALQSLSLVALQAAGQQPSPPTHSA